MGKVSYHVFQYDSELDSKEALEEKMTEIFSHDNYQMVDMKDMITQTGKYVAIVHYTIEEVSSEVVEARVNESVNVLFYYPILNECYTTLA